MNIRSGMKYGHQAVGQSLIEALPTPRHLQWKMVVLTLKKSGRQQTRAIRVALLRSVRLPISPRITKPPPSHTKNPRNMQGAPTQISPNIVIELSGLASDACPQVSAEGWRT